ncbi:MAG: hypothetical protein J7539_01140 [Niabella sp.]|nr:hypothetical protein [Niabella sp.]
MRSTIFLLAVALFSCRSSSRQWFYDAVNNNFLNIADTNTYRFKSFFAMPGGLGENYSQNASFLISVSDSLSSDKAIDEAVSDLVKDNIDFAEVVNHPYYLGKLDLVRINNTGQFRIVSDGGRKPIDSARLVGKLCFSNAYIFEDKAILSYTKSVSQKAGATYILLVKKVGGKWKQQLGKVVKRW